MSGSPLANIATPSHLAQVLVPIGNGQVHYFFMMMYDLTILILIGSNSSVAADLSMHFWCLNCLLPLQNSNHKQ